ncbi:MAG TPA: hypothetical protein VI792_11520, partial [Candidatus Eisenbacteria bacterium]
PDPARPPAPRLPGAGGAAAWGVALAGAGVAAAMYASSPALAWRSDGAFHAAVTLSVARGGVPPEDPYFAGIRLLYFWGTHAWAALWLALAPALAPWTPLIALNLAGTLAALLAVCALAARLGGGARAQWLACGLAAFGAAPFAWGWVAARAVAGEVRGLPELRRLLTQGVDLALRSMSPGLLHPSLVFAADKFLVLTPFALGLALFAVGAVALLEMSTRPRAGAIVSLALVVGAALFVHPVAGVALLGAGVAAALAGALARRGAPFPARAWGVALGAPALALSPYLAAIDAGRHPGLAAGLSWRGLDSLVVGGALVVPAGLGWLARRVRSGPARALFAAAVALALAGLLGRASGDNQSKLFNLLYLLLSAPAALGWLALHHRLARAGRAALAALLALAALPTALLCAWAYASERGQLPESCHAPTPSERSAYAWARDSLAADAVLVDTGVEEGGAATLAVSARRALLWGGEFMARKWDYAPGALSIRRRAAVEIAGDRPPTEDVRAFAAGLGREVALVCRRPAGASPAEFARTLAARASWTRPLYANADLAILRVEARP